MIMAQVARKLSRVQSILARAGITLAAVGLFSLLRPDVASSASTRLRTTASNTSRRLLSPQMIDSYVREKGVRKLQIGAGEFSKPGWLNTDIEPREGQAYLDATKPFPIPDGSIDIIFAEQLIEHLSLDDGRKMLRECYRVLKPGGKVRLATPNLVRFVELMQADKTPEQRKFIDAKVAWHEWKNSPDPASMILNYQMHEFGHQFLYTPLMLRSVMEEAGFRNVRQFQSGESDDPGLKNIEVRSESNVAELDRFETMVFEAAKP
jgi:predicted SAM-dependent methyltransferase